ncbi:MAG: hypothetical protein IKQ04_05070 [Oscillospiraceae bacterium]|nr:hypothetical protein [Oscillospiraceae bacterium]
MFGYVRPRQDLLEERDLAAYRAAYCGLCRALGKGYGFAARFLVNYDMTFLYLLRASAAEAAPAGPCWCPARVCGKKTCTLDPGGYETVAACTVVLCVEKLRDDIRDKGFFKGLPARFLNLVFRGAYRRAARRLPAFAALASEQLRALAALEAAESPSIDAVSDAFARIVAGCAGDLEDPALRRPMEQILYQTGRFLYLADALDDLKEDWEKGAYNPLRYRFAVTEGVLSPEDQAYLTQLTDSSVNLAGAALNLLPGRSHHALLENIIYLGLPAVFAAVRAGKFRARAPLFSHRRREREAGTREEAPAKPGNQKKLK